MVAWTSTSHHDELRQRASALLGGLTVVRDRGQAWRAGLAFRCIEMKPNM
jgi:hypothetical protein